jgi:glucokinase
MDRRFVVVSGLPGSGKSSLAGQLTPILGLPVIDKDEILERLFETKGVGGFGCRRALSRESDLLFRMAAEHSDGALLVSFWRLPGMASDSGTPTDWLPLLSRRIVTLHCECPPAVAAARYCRRRRHPGHLDEFKSEDEILMSIKALAGLKQMNVGRQLRCDTSSDVNLELLAAEISEALDRR